LLNKWIDRQRRERLRREIIEGCCDMADVYLDIEQEFHPLEEEVHRVIEDSNGPDPRLTLAGRRNCWMI
jgi:hypothetical protein